MQVALKVDVDTLRGTQEGVPALLRLFDQYQVRATFLFSLGPDHTGRALRRVFRPGFLAKVRRTSVASHYGLKTLMYGTLLPGPHIGRRAGHIMRDVLAAGHEVGIHCYDHIRWQDFVANRNAEWTRHEMQRAMDVFQDVFGHRAEVIGAAGWQINAHALALEEELGFRYASDVRGESAFYPLMEGVASRCVQIPTTLPTLDELIGSDDMSAANVHEVVFDASRKALPDGHVYTLHAELEGMALSPVMQRLLGAWQAAGDTLGTLRDTFATLDQAALPTRPVVWDQVPGRSGVLAVQGAS
ncbi:MAG: 4-deoxy-4-formamido-L-arabinose-phosphoundecaprenol deformylase [Gammaproteobacteria bacterium]|jgi:peptidoglycan/xylan/chitin deacetylase (PgdA/CDA1 family)|nr:4-deoxy-4-formamido-L-arabinose-phosphoundecaprenol deformylase [Gammaproteobacteria bacterium]